MGIDFNFQNRFDWQTEPAKGLNEWTRRISRTVACLREWQALEYTGHFIDVEAEMLERIKQVYNSCQPGTAITRAAIAKAEGRAQ